MAGRLRGRRSLNVLELTLFVWVGLRTLSGILADAAAFRGRGIIQLGLLLLIATPVARVAFSVVAYALEPMDCM
jgi:uncharacterized membrane protein